MTYSDRTECWDLNIKFCNSILVGIFCFTVLATETLVNLNEKDMPEELSHEEVIALKDLDLDATLLDIASDDWVDDMASTKQAQACPLFIY